MASGGEISYIERVDMVFAAVADLDECVLDIATVGDKNVISLKGFSEEDANELYYYVIEKIYDMLVEGAVESIEFFERVFPVVVSEHYSLWDYLLDDGEFAFDSVFVRVTEWNKCKWLVDRYLELVGEDEDRWLTFYAHRLVEEGKLDFAILLEREYSGMCNLGERRLYRCGCMDEILSDDVFLCEKDGVKRLRLLLESSANVAAVKTDGVTRAMRWWDNERMSVLTECREWAYDEFG